MSLIGSLFTGALSIVSPAAGAALGLFRKARKAAAPALKWLFLHPAWIVTIGFGIFALLQMHEARHWKKLDDRDAAGWTAEKQAHAITKRSLADANVKIDDNNNRIAAAAKELDREKQEAAANEARLNERWKSTQATVSALEADARDPKRKPCTVSDQARKGLEGL